MILQRRQIIIIVPIVAIVFLGLIFYSYLSVPPFVAGPPEKQFEGPAIFVQVTNGPHEPLSDIEIIIFPVRSANDIAHVPGGHGPIPGNCDQPEVEVVVEPVEPRPGCSSSEMKVTNNTGWVVIDSSSSQYFLLKIMHADYPETRLTLAYDIVRVDPGQSVYVRISLPSGIFWISENEP